MSKSQESIFNNNLDQTSYEFGREIRIKKIHEAVGNVKNKKILDIGCWTGDIIHPFVKKNTCFGTDISDNALKAANDRGIMTYKLNFEEDDFPFDKGFFDIILCSEVLEHLIDQDTLLKKIYQILKKDGLFICSVPNINTPISWFIQIFLDLPPKNSARYRSVHYRDFTYRSAKKMLELNGFEISKISGTFIYPSKGIISQKIANLFPRFSENFIFACKKSVSPINRDVPEVIFDIRELFNR